MKNATKDNSVLLNSHIASSITQAQPPPPTSITVLKEDKQLHSCGDSESDPNVMSTPAGLPSANPTKSYWLRKNLSPVLEGHRTTPELPAEADVVVVGSGITGAFAAWFLKTGVDFDSGPDLDDVLEEKKHSSERKKAGQKVAMLEAREACSGATGRNGGHCQPQVYSSPAIAGFELETYHFLEKLIKEHDIPCDWVSQSGVHVYLSQDIFDYARKCVEDLKTTHPHLAAQVTVIDPKNNKSQQTPTLSSLRIPNAKGAIIQQHAASLWPYKLVSWLLEHLLSEFTAEEFNLQTNTPVTSLHRMSQATAIPTSPEGNPPQWLLSTPRGTIRAKKVILATNGYTSYLLPKMKRLITPVRGQVTALLPPAFHQSTTTSLQQSSEEGIAKLDHTYIYLASESGKEGYNTKEDYLIQRPVRPDNKGGEFIFGGGRDFASSPAYGFGEWRDDTIDQDVGTYLRRHLSPPLDLRPDLQSSVAGTIRDRTSSLQLKPTHQWTGIMGYTRDQHPLVGPVPASLLPDHEPPTSGSQDKDGAAAPEGEGEGVWVCAGYNGHGMPVAALSARVVVEQVLGLSSSSSRLRTGTLPKEFHLTEERARFS